MKQLKLKCLKAKLLPIIAFLAIGCGLIIYTVSTILLFAQGTPDPSKPANAINGAVLVFVFGIGFLLAAIGYVINIMRGKYMKPVMDYISNSFNPEAAREKEEDFVNNTPEINRLRYNNEFICGEINGTISFGETSKLAWVYMYTLTTTYRNNIKSKCSSIILAFCDGSTQTVEIKSPAAAEEHMKKLEAFYPQAIVGYTDELGKMFATDLNGFLNLRFHSNTIEKA